MTVWGLFARQKFHLRAVQSKFPVQLRVSARVLRYCSSDVATKTTPGCLDLDKFKKLYFFYEDYLVPQPIYLLKMALKDYFPPVGTEYRATSDPNWIHLGYQHVYFRPHLHSNDICDDGADYKFLPGPRNVWKYRLWAGGSVVCNKKFPCSFSTGSRASLLERATNVRVVGQEGNSQKVFVTIERKFAIPPESHDSKMQIARFLGQQEDDQDDPFQFMTETENICFLRDRPTSLQDERKIKPPSNPVFTHTMTPKRSLLFQFSALTYNAHSIHIDREFAREEYGAKDLVVHGPLTQVLMMEFMQHYLKTLLGDMPGFPFLKNFNYTNLQPLYVNQPLTLCCKPTTGSEKEKLKQAKTWQVWIQTGDGENTSCAVRGTVDVDLLTTAE